MDIGKHKYLLIRIGLEIRDKNIVFTGKKKSHKELIGFNDIKQISINKGQVSLIRKFGFWLNRILLYDKYSGRAMFDDSLDYRYLYCLSIQLKNGHELTKNIKDFDLISTSNAIEILNNEIKHTM